MRKRFQLWQVLNYTPASCPIHPDISAAVKPSVITALRRMISLLEAEKLVEPTVDNDDGFYPRFDMGTWFDILRDTSIDIRIDDDYLKRVEKAARKQEYHGCDTSGCIGGWIEALWKIDLNENVIYMKDLSSVRNGIQLLMYGWGDCRLDRTVHNDARRSIHWNPSQKAAAMAIRNLLAYKDPLWGVVYNMYNHNSPTE